MDKIEPENGNEDPMNSDSKDMSSDWRFGNAYSANISIGMVPKGNAMVASNADLMESSSCSSASMVGSFCPPIWNQAANSRHLGFCDINVENNASTSHTSGISGLGPPRTGIERALDMGWTPPISLLKGGMFLPTVPGMLPQSLSQFPADSGFIERAARFSCFSGGNSGDMMNPFGLPDSMNSYFRVAAPLQWPQQSFAGRASKSISSLQAQKIEINRAQNSEDVNMSADHAAIEGSPLKNEKKSDSLVTSHGETKQTAGVPVNESDVAEFSTGPGQDKTAMLDGACGGPSSEQGNGTKKRKGSVQDTELHQLKGFQKPVSEATKDNNEIQKGDQNQASSVSKPLGKHGQQGSQASDSPKEEYIHVRARRGQATNSHSLAERVRREKISERMKFLQDLVPGCSKVTGKAVMLDEIINYVQSLQRQVEFLSMKLATVNPRLDFNIEGLLAKDMLQSHPGPSSSLVFPPDMTIPYPPFCPSQPGLIQGGFPGMGNSSDALQRSITSQLTAMSRGYKEPTSQVPNVWEDELHNVVQMGFNPATPINTQDLSGPLRPGHMKPEL